MSFKLPPLLYNEEGQLRTVGFELEFSNVTIEKVVKLIQALYGGQVAPENRYLQKVVGTRLGDFTVEFDLTLLAQKSYQKVFEKFNIRLEDYKVGSGNLAEGVENVLESIVGKIFPYEIAAPPVPITQLDQLENLREALYQHHAQGTEAFPTNAFGTHINVETPRTNPETLVKYLQAFLLLYPWLLEAGDTDLARKISPFIDPYPDDYIQLLLTPGYEPDLPVLVQDYHQYNPDRNRPVDMYPLFAALNSALLAPFHNLGKVKARKTFHYRLPNSCVSDPEWTLAHEWNNWVAIEELAADHERIKQMSREYLELKNNTFLGFDNKWVKRTEQWLMV